MHSRRNLLKTGVVFCSCCLLDQAARAQQPRKLPVIVSGKRLQLGPLCFVQLHCKQTAAAHGNPLAKLRVASRLSRL